MKRTIMIGMALGTLVFAGVAYAALNTYTASLSFTTSKSGSPKHPVGIAFTEKFAAANAISTNRAAPLVDLKVTVYGLKADTKPFPTCSMAKILTGPKFDKNCPAKSITGHGQIQSLLGGTDLSRAGSQCNPGIDIINAGNNKQWDFFTAVGTQCSGLTTGQTPPYLASIKQVGKNLVFDTPLPPSVSTAVAGHQGLYGSLIRETIVNKVVSTKVGGKTHYYVSSVACKGHSRPWSVAFTATDSSGTKETKVVKGSAKC